jgi:hypothetical protein
MSEKKSGASVSEDTLYNIIASEAGGFYNLLTTISSAFLGGMLIFVDKFVASFTIWSVLILGFGLLCLVGAIISIVYVRNKNLIALDKYRTYLRNKTDSGYDELIELDKKKQKWTIYASWLFSVGILCLLFFGIITVIICKR